MGMRRDEGALPREVMSTVRTEIKNMMSRDMEGIDPFNCQS